MPSGGEASALPGDCVCDCLYVPPPPRTHCLLAAGPGATAGRGSAVGYQSGYFHNGCLRRGGAGGGRSGEGEGAEEQPGGWLSKLGLAQQEASSLELEPEPGFACPQGPQSPPTRPPPACHLPSDQVKGGSPNLSLPSVSSLLHLSGWVWVGVDQGGPRHHP